MKYYLPFLFLLLTSLAGHAQYPMPGLYTLRLNDTDKNVVAEIEPSSPVSTKPDRMYYWYSSNHIRSTQGSYSGQLLNGAYSEFYSNKNLKQQGRFKDGLKDEVWNQWTANGLLTKTETWSEGIKQGVFFIYDEKGQVKQSGAYNKNLLNGDLTSYHNGQVTEVVTYKNGVIVPTKAPHFWNKLNPFKKKQNPVSTAPILNTNNAPVTEAPTIAQTAF